MLCASIRKLPTSPPKHAGHDQFSRMDRQWLGHPVSHPKDFTPVCTTELDTWPACSRSSPSEHENYRLSVDPVTSHGKWAADIEETQGHKVTYPMIGDPDSRWLSSMTCCPPSLEPQRWPHGADNATVRTVFVIGPDKEDQADADLSDEQRTQFR